MKINRELIRGLLTELIDENPLACRAVFSITEIVFTREIPTLCVSLGKTSVLRINDTFIAKHARTESEIKALLLHEFLHILLRHTVRFTRITPVRNLALDACINAIIHRQLGEAYSSVFSRYYGSSTGLLQLLRPQQPHEKHRLRDLKKRPALTPSEKQDLALLEIQFNLHYGIITSEDVYDLSRELIARDPHLLKDEPANWIGNHDAWGDPLDDLSPEAAARIRRILDEAGNRFVRCQQGSPLTTSTSPPFTDPAWVRLVRPILARLLCDHPRTTNIRHEPVTSLLPVLTPHDRRGWLRILWNPLVAENAWSSHHRRPRGSVNVYFDVSGSMNDVLPPLIRLLAEFHTTIRSPFWAFSETVEPAVIRNGFLRTKTTGGTSFNAVLHHIAHTRPEKALIITDGFVEQAIPALVRQTSFCRIEALISPGGSPDRIATCRYVTTRLPPLQKKNANPNPIC